MKLIGFNFTKINLEKKSDKLKDLKITTGIDIMEVKEAKATFLNSPDTLLVVKFDYSINYEKDIANLKFQGNILVSLEEKQAKDTLDQWKNKKLPGGFKLNLFNIILKKCSLKALQFEEEFNLPLHVPLPSFKPKQGKK